MSQSYPIIIFPMTFNKQLKIILDCIADGVFTVDRDWNITYFNRAAESIVGIPRKDAVGEKCWDVFHSSACDGCCILKEALRLNSQITNKSIFILRQGGEKIPISISASPLYDGSGNLVGGVETFRDLSEIQFIRQGLKRTYSRYDIVGKSPSLKKILDILPQISGSNATVLITGESGTGKELVARAIHNLSMRKERPFVVVNCGALPETLLESELFGYKKGAFTDAKRDKPGRFKGAHGGTLFLDEIGEMSPSIQAKLLRVLEDKCIYPLGSIKEEKVDVRIIAATNRELEKEVEKGRFRLDLFYRLNVVHIHLPPLRERREDIPLLVEHFISRFNLLEGKDIKGVSEDVMGLLLRHSYPGNIRELENIIEYAFILCKEGFIHLEHLPEYLYPLKFKQKLPLGDTPMSLEEIKCRAVEMALQRNGGKKMATCKELGISKDTLRRMLKRCREKYNLHL